MDLQNYKKRESISQSDSLTHSKQLTPLKKNKKKTVIGFSPSRRMWINITTVCVWVITLSYLPNYSSAVLPSLPYNLIVNLVKLPNKDSADLAVADPGFPREGGGAPTYDFAKISQKLHEIERIWTPGGGTSIIYYVDPPLLEKTAEL